MNAKAQRIAIAEACGISYPRWECTNPECVEFGIIAEVRIDRSGRALYCPGNQCGNDLSLIVLPDYLNDLNAMHSAEKVLSLSQRDQYQQWLYRIVEKECRMAPIYWLAINSTAKQRAEAFLRTIGKWEDGK